MKLNKNTKTRHFFHLWNEGRDYRHLFCPRLKRCMILMKRSKTFVPDHKLSHIFLTLVIKGGKPEPKWRETSRSKGWDNQQQTQPAYGVHASIRTRATLVGPEEIAQPTAPPLLPFANSPFWFSQIIQLKMHLSSGNQTLSWTFDCDRNVRRTRRRKL